MTSADFAVKCMCQPNRSAPAILLYQIPRCYIQKQRWFRISGRRNSRLYKIIKFKYVWNQIQILGALYSPHNIPSTKEKSRFLLYTKDSYNAKHFAIRTREIWVEIRHMHTLIVGQTAILVTTRIPIFANTKYWFCTFNVFLYVFCGIPIQEKKRKEKKIQFMSCTKTKIRSTNIYSFNIIRYPLAKSNRKSWKPTLFLSHLSHSVISFRTNDWVWSTFGTPLKLSPVLWLPWNSKKK